MFLTFYCYLSIFLFLTISVYKARQYGRMPLHGRLELYPVPKEAGRQEYGGSYYEEPEWWRKPRQISRVVEIREMLKEMLFIKKLFDHQRGLWWLSYAFHLGIYCLATWTALLVCQAALNLYGAAGTGWLAGILQLLIMTTGIAGLILATAGAGALFVRRLADSSLKPYTTGQEYFNLLLIFVVLGTGVYAWSPDPSFGRASQVMEQLLSFQALSLNGPETIHLLVLGIMFGYIPLSKMSHYVGKYFSFHKVLWENEPNLAGSDMAKTVKKAVGYRPQTSWSASHIQSSGIKAKEN